MSKDENVSKPPPDYTNRHYAVLTLVTAIVYYFSNPKPESYYDYTFRVAANILDGQIAFTEKQPSWLNEFVPFEGFYYSVFPLGSVVTMMPFALLKVVGFINEMPAAFLAAFCAGISCLFYFLIGRRYPNVDQTRLVVMVLGFMFGTWTWTNLAMAGAWQLALGFALVGELGAIYFTVHDRRPLIAGIFFALAFGNRTEVLLTAPVFFWLLNRRDAETQTEKTEGNNLPKKKRKPHLANKEAKPSARRLSVSAVNIRAIALFCIVPFVLGVTTLVYNYVRFHSFTDFGYARIPGVLDEPWYNHGIFSYKYIPRQIWEMAWRTWETRSGFPYLTPNAFSSSIFWSSPFILFAFRLGARDKTLKWVAWLAILVLCVLLWMHGNSGGWQFGYRYAMVCLPWLFIIMLETAPKKISPLEWAAYVFAFVANAYATWLFLWTDYMK